MRSAIKRSRAHATRNLHHASEHVGRHAILPGCAGLVGEGNLGELFRHLGIGLPLIDNIRGFVGLLEMWAGEMRVGQAGRVPEQVLHGHLASRRLQRQRFCGGVVGVGGDLEIGEGRNIARNGIRDQELAFLGEHHRRNRDDRFCHRGNAEDRVRRHHRAVLAIAVTERLKTRDLSAPRDQHHRAGHEAFVDVGLQGIADALQALRRQSDIFGFVRPRHFECHCLSSYFQN